jgi:hypothetical protein
MEFLGRTWGSQSKSVCRIKRKRKPVHPEDIDFSILGFRNPSAGWKIAEIYRKRSSTVRGGLARELENLFHKRRDYSIEEPKIEVVEGQNVEIDFAKAFSFLSRKVTAEDPIEQLMFYSSMCVAKMFSDVELDPRHPAIRDMIQVMFEKGGEDAIELYLESEENISKLRKLGV